MYQMKKGVMNAMKKVYTAEEVIKILQANGWYQIKPPRKKRGTSHKQFKHPTRKGRVTVPCHKGKDLNIWEIKSIEVQSGLKLL